ncbi:MotA/TolQ/ExbB proton channel family protein [Celerinatantimonas yamalensis]|uniref:MotA/TolQ/ExbB proton channel family protein n=1 Tax=Celerinatantimonas yamalensis TaxID=559956 RepID=A0ABW9G8J8_9GAMM
MKHMAALLAIISLSASAANSPSFATSAQTISQQDTQLNQLRQTKFLTHLQQQRQLLAQSHERLIKAKQRQATLKASFVNNETRLTQLSEQLHQRSGELGKVFDVLRTEADRFRHDLQQSLTSAEFGDRHQKFAWISKDQIPSSQDLRTLNQQLLTQLLASGRISQFKRPVIAQDGQQQTQRVTRLGEFELFNQQGQYLSWSSPTQTLEVIAKQPSSARDFVSGHSNRVLIDPTRGQLLAIQAQLPTFMQRIAQGGAIGYVIITLGLISLLIALYRLATLVSIERKVNRQLRSLQPRDDNPLGRILACIPNRLHTLDTLEVYIDEAVSIELPKLERSHTLVKLVAGVAPLLGLLGTVTGMIGTFQAITLFGTSDPKMMASGISQALMTTVLGLVAAIPLLFAHNLLSTRARRISQILQQQTLALLADRLKQEPADESA